MAAASRQTMIFFCHSVKQYNYPDGPLHCLVFKRCPSCSLRFDHTVLVSQEDKWLLKKKKTRVFSSVFHLSIKSFITQQTAAISICSLSVLHIWYLCWSLIRFESKLSLLDLMNQKNNSASIHGECAVCHSMRVLYKWDVTMSLCHSSPSSNSLIDARSRTLKRTLWKGFFDCGKIAPSTSFDYKGGKCP